MSSPDAVSAEDIVQIWEQGRRHHPIDRALTILAVLSRQPRAELAAISVEGRDRMLLAWRCRIFGDDLAGYAACPACGCGVDVAVSPRGLTEPEEHFTVDVEGCPVAVRLPNSLDLAAIVGCESVEAARAMLISRCVDAGEADCSEQDIALIEAELGRRAEVSAATLALTCPNCGNGWKLELDVAAFAWREIDILAGRLLRQVDELARRYGWSEREILSLSSARRRFYLELAS
jgi:hypothetical protein